MSDFFRLSDYQYSLPEELIARYPCDSRDQSRLMIIDRRTGNISEMVFCDLVDFLQPKDHLIFNDTRVIPARLFGKKKTGAKVEIFLVHKLEKDRWEVLAKPAKKLPKGTEVIFSEGFTCVVTDRLADGNRVVDFTFSGDFDQILNQYGKIPLPHYMNRSSENVDSERYQTIYASEVGAVAAPTAGLHFSSEMMEKMTNKGIAQTKITLHVGIGTFRPVQTEDIRDHLMHKERFIISEQSASELNQGVINRQICIGTTTCRALESAFQEEKGIVPGAYDTNIFIYPGYRFRYVRSLLTNFHLPGSSLLMLVSAFGGSELMREAYSKAIKEKYRFYSYGDAMLII